MASQIVVVLSLRFGLAFVLLRAGVPKVLDANRFRRSVDDYAILPAALMSPVALAVPLVEVAAAVTLLGGVELRWTAIVVVALLMTYSLAIALNLARGRRISCGCSALEKGNVEISWRSIVRNCGLAAAAGAVARWPAQPLALVPGVSDRYDSSAWISEALAWLTIVGSLLLTWLLVREPLRAIRVLRALRR